ncbi:MAG: hypothetical protein U0R17_03100 [Acidimicrobiia bacterium]
MFSHNAYSIEPDLNATFAPGEDGQSVSLTTSIKIPTSNSSSNNTSIRKSSPLIWSDKVLLIENLNFDMSPQICVLDDTNNTRGVTHEATLTNRVTGEVVLTTTYCSTSSTSAPDNNLPVPPSYLDIWRAVFNQEFNDVAQNSGAYVAPLSPGLTNLPTHIWAQFPHGQVITRDVSLPGGYRVRANAKISSINILIKTNLNTKIIATAESNDNQINGGSFENPLAIYKFTKKGEYKIASAIVWVADDATLTGPGFSPIVIPLGSLRIEINRNYTVQQLKPALVK